MIKVTRVCKDYPKEGGGNRRVLSDVSFDLTRGEKIAVLGRNGAGKSTLIRLLGGIELPSSGTIERSMSISWPVALAGGVHGILTGNDNIRFIARVYGKPFQELRDYVEDIAQLGKFLSEPVRTYSTGMAGRLNFALSLAVDFDCYLIDEVIAAGDHGFQVRCHEELFEKRADRALILASHVPEIVRSYCSRALVLHRGRAKMFDDLALALDIYSAF
ncbi:MAG TPA: ABC transporter ATP-binding protein [Stellaceae bacterium]|jgi:capsular polysaccharide transport system ATP-binding protein|nr:ABC transporter ATP-binding protein [Stellaceae bacterium]